MQITICDRCRAEIKQEVGRPRESGIKIDHLCEKCNDEYNKIVDWYNAEKEKIQTRLVVEVTAFMTLSRNVDL